MYERTDDLMIPGGDRKSISRVFGTAGIKGLPKSRISQDSVRKEENKTDDRVCAWQMHRFTSIRGRRPLKVKCSVKTKGKAEESGSYKNRHVVGHATLALRQEVLASAFTLEPTPLT